jgi:hypothetical protein
MELAKPAGKGNAKCKSDCQLHALCSVPDGQYVLATPQAVLSAAAIILAQPSLEEVTDEMQQLDER